MENKTKKLINKLLLLFAVLITSSCPLNPLSIFHNYVLVWWKMCVNEALWMIPYWTLGILKQGFHPDPLHVPLVYSILPFMLILHQVTTPKTPGLNLTPGRKPWLEGLSAWLQIAWTQTPHSTFLDPSDLFYFGALLNDHGCFARPLPPVLPDSFHTSPYKGEVPKRGWNRLWLMEWPVSSSC